MESRTLRRTLQAQFFHALQQTRIECKPEGHPIEMPVAKHGHHSMFGPAVDLCRESRPADPRDTHEPMFQVLRAAVESNHIGHLSTNDFLTGRRYPLATRKTQGTRAVCADIWPIAAWIIPFLFSNWRPQLHSQVGLKELVHFTPHSQM